MCIYLMKFSCVCAESFSLWSNIVCILSGSSATTANISFDVAKSCLDNQTYQAELSFDFCLLLCQGFGLWTLVLKIITLHVQTED